MSVLGKKWKINNNDPDLSVKDKILKIKGLTDPDDLASFLKPDFKKDFNDPYLLKGMDRAVKRVYEAVQNHERIIVYGDYDVDGISAAAIMVITLQHLGASVSYRLPHRLEDGYGLSDKFIDEFKEIGVGLLITVDCGISNADEIKRAKEKGIDVIITDHHKIPRNYPDSAYEVLHPLRKDSSYPYKWLTGAGVAFKFAHALLEKDGHEQEDNSLIFSLLDLASLGTVADCGPITGENRLIVKKGLEMLPRTKWEGLKFLQEMARVDLTQPLNTFTIGFQIAPRINAAGRIDSPYYALQLLIQGKKTQTAKRLAEKLEELNLKRQKMMRDAFAEAEERVKKTENEKIYIEYDKNWHVGIIGLVAGKISDKYMRPAIVMQDFGDYLVASARSPKFFDVIEAITGMSQYLDNFGGHAQAAGFSIKKENLKPFVKEMRKYTESVLSTCDLKPTLDIDCEINPDELTWETLEFLESLEPYGVANEKPVFLIKNAQVDSVRNIGKKANHISFKVSKDGKSLRSIGFNMGKFVDYARTHRSLDVVFQLQRNKWKGKNSIEMKLVDFSGSDE
jgi:single-stranded-DNA-specific exonuclease